MDEGIRFNPNGTVTIPIEGKDYELGRPKFRHLRHFRERISQISDAAQVTVLSLAEEAAKHEEGSAEQEELLEQVRYISRHGYEITVWPWLREVYEELGNAPLPESLDEAPSEIADMSLAMKILDHWRTVPLAPGAKGAN